MMRRIRDDIAELFSELQNPQVRHIDVCSQYPLRYLPKLQPESKGELRIFIKAANMSRHSWRIIREGGKREQDLREIHAQLAAEINRRR